MTPTSFALGQNYPNPFNPSTSIWYSVPARGRVTLTVYDLLGRAVATLVDEVKQPGVHSLTWDASNFPSGVYACRMTAPGFSSSRTLLLVK